MVRCSRTSNKGASHVLFLSGFPLRWRVAFVLLVARWGSPSCCALRAGCRRSASLRWPWLLGWRPPRRVYLVSRPVMVWGLRPPFLLLAEAFRNATPKRRVEAVSLCARKRLRTPKGGARRPCCAAHSATHSEATVRHTSILCRAMPRYLSRFSGGGGTPSPRPPRHGPHNTAIALWPIAHTYHPPPPEK